MPPPRYKKYGAYLVLFLTVMLALITSLHQLQLGNLNSIAFKTASRRAAIIPELTPQAIDEFMEKQPRPLVFVNGTLNVVENMLPRRCVSFRFRGSDELYTLEEAVELLNQRSSDEGLMLRIGVQFAEDPSMFLPVRIKKGGNVYHMYHFVEHIVIAFAALTKLRSLHEANAWSNATRISVPWLFAAHASRKEFCGGPTNINCLIAELVFWSSQNTVFEKHLGIIGLDAMDHYHTDPSNPKEKGIQYRIDTAKTFFQNERRFDLADGFLKVERFGCNNGGINKPWHRFIDDFPSELWYRTIQARLELHVMRNSLRIIDASSSQAMVCYIDRQNTDRKLPDEHHEWLVHTFSSDPSVLFLPLRMEDYSAVQQIQQASRCDMMIGMHGNGLTHILWMKPGSSVIEFFWRYNFQYDYATAAQLLKHRYLAVFNGRVLNQTLIEQRDPSLRLSPTRKESQKEPIEESMRNFEALAKPAILQMLEDCIKRKKASSSEV